MLAMLARLYPILSPILNIGMGQNLSPMGPQL
jgi:hypothetical protein